MDDIFLQNALSRSLGLDVSEESIGFVSVTSRGSTGHGTLREDVHHLYVEIESLPAHWVGNLRYELSKRKIQGLELLEFGDDAKAKDAYAQYCRNLNLGPIDCDASRTNFSCVAIQVDDKHRSIIILRDRKRIAG